MADVHIEGGRKIAAVAKALRQMGTDRTIVNEMAKRIRRSAPNLRKAIKRSALGTMPRRGGLNKWVASSSIRVSVTRSERTAGVRLVIGRNSAGGRSDLKNIDAGSTRHPLWGNREHWYPQTLEPGFATKVMDGPEADQFRDDALAAIDDAVRKVLDGL